MAQIPSLINGVLVQFSGVVVNDVDQRVIDALELCINPHVATGHSLTSIYISSAFDSHQIPSRHMQHKAVDISRINGIRIAVGYPQNTSLKAIVDTIQDTFEGYSDKRENFGPHIKKKMGMSWNIAGHNDHIHLSVN
ncbi:MAG: hypothetical protein LBE78_02515 [Burkholderiaceae bacterium]|jgi:hypothetical protein|nr:hypothetical protein [Burkholderiaceae bacterium]